MHWFKNCKSAALPKDKTLEEFFVVRDSKTVATGDESDLQSGGTGRI